VQLGGQLFKTKGDYDEEKYRHFDVEADNDENIPEPIVTGTVTQEYREILKYAPKWTTWPDFEQCRWLNDSITWLWPGLNRAICKMVRSRPACRCASHERPSLRASSGVQIARAHPHRCPGC
jgi:hypothetical protein